MQTYCYFVAYEFTLTDGSKSGTGCCFCERKKFDSFNKFLDATQNKEYNDNIKFKRESAEQTLRMMMW